MTYEQTLLKTKQAVARQSANYRYRAGRGPDCLNFALRPCRGGSNCKVHHASGKRLMQTSPVMSCQPSQTGAEFPAMQLSSQPAGISPAEPGPDLEMKRAIRDLLEVLPKDVLDELNSGAIDLKDPAFLDGLTDHVSRLSLANPQEGRKILGKIIKLKKVIARGLRESDPELAVSATITRTGTRVGRNDACPCGSGRKYKQCCLRKNQ
jgi:hypothetical protein